jgi:hypothetical protein
MMFYWLDNFTQCLLSLIHQGMGSVTKYYICDQSKGCDSFLQGTHPLGYTPSLVYKCNDLWNTSVAVILSILCVSFSLRSNSCHSLSLNSLLPLSILQHIISTCSRDQRREQIARCF